MKDDHEVELSPIPIVKPRTPSLEALEDKINVALDTGMLTNSRFVGRFEKEIAEYLEVEHAVAVCNATTGLIMTLSVLDLAGEILVPSFTFSATGHVCFWAGLTPVFVDCDARDWTVRLTDCMAEVCPETTAILAVHTFGNPAEVRALEEFAAEHNLALVFDAAHAIGTVHGGHKVGGAGKASVFSLTPTKIITAGEGGVITTNDRYLAEELRTFRNYGDAGNYDCERMGLNGRMPELSAILAAETLKYADEEVAGRNERAQVYRRGLADVPGVRLQHVQPGNRSSYKDYTIVIDESEFGATRDDVAEFLASTGVMTRKYFSPPLHQQRAYRGRVFRHTSLVHTEYISRRALTLPMYAGLDIEDVRRVCWLIQEFQEASGALENELQTVILEPKN